MQLLTPEEKAIMTGKIEGTRKRREHAVFKLRQLQERLTDPEYIAAIDALIPRAELVAKDLVRHKVMCFDKAFHGEMNRLAREAGLR